MGCDIHVHTEKRYLKSDNTIVWVNTDNFRCNPNNILYPEYKEQEEYLLNQIYNGRDYNLFGVLAGVRIKSDFQISEPKGLPDDISEWTKRQFCKWEYSPTWFTLKELLDYYNRMKKNKKIIWKHDYNNPYYLGNFKYFLKCVKRKALEDLDYYSIYPKEKIFADYGEDYRVIIWFDS